MLIPALMVFQSMVPVWASLERILGRSIPRLRHSPAVKRNRVYVAVPLVMGVVWLVATAAFCGASGVGGIGRMGCVRDVGVLRGRGAGGAEAGAEFRMIFG